MSKVKYRVREFTPKGNQGLGTHSIYAEVVINNDISNAELAKKIAARTGYKAYECQSVIAAIADIVAEEVLESNRISLSNEEGVKLVSIYPKVTGSISDNDVQQNPDKYNGATAATEDMLTPDMLSWALGATVGVKFSKKFAIDKQAQKVKMTTADVTTEDEDEQPNTNNGDDDMIPQSGGGENTGGNGTLVDDPDGD